jgi:hypothetical protein
MEWKVPMCRWLKREASVLVLHSFRQVFAQNEAPFVTPESQCWPTARLFCTPLSRPCRIIAVIQIVAFCVQCL